MRTAAFAALAALALTGALSACAPPPAAQPSDPRLDALFYELQAAPNAAAADRVEKQILARLAQTASPSVEVLMERALAAQSTKDFDRAVAFLEEASRLEPAFVEPWRRRAAIAFEKGDHDAALAAIEEVLRREPRHFGAYLALAAIAEAQERPAAALEAYREALRIHPQLEIARQGEARLAPQVEGRET